MLRPTAAVSTCNMRARGVAPWDMGGCPLALIHNSAMQWKLAQGPFGGRGRVAPGGGWAGNRAWGGGEHEATGTLTRHEIAQVATHQLGQTV